MARVYIGVDLHREVIQLCVHDAEGKVLKEGRYRGASLEEGLAVVEEIASYGKEAAIAVEALGLNRWFVNACRARGLDVRVADPVKMGLQIQGKKSDRRDAQEIARRLRLGDIERFASTYYPSEEEYGARKLLRTRHDLVKRRLEQSNAIRAMLNAYRVIPPCGALYSHSAFAWLESVELENPRLRPCLRARVEILKVIHAQIEALDDEIEMLRADPRVASAARQLPGVGTLTAATLVYELGDVRRFRSSRAAASYGGIVPRVANSADVQHHGAVTKRGSPELRWILNQWAVRLLTRENVVQAWAKQRLARMHKNKVRVALGRRLLCGVYVMLRRGEAFSLSRCLAHESA